MIDHLIYDEQWLSFTDAAPYPICDMRYCDYWSTQVSYYGNDDHYRWHYDTIPGDTSRIITMIYYFHSLPKKFSGGQLCLTDGLLWGENIVGQSATTEIEPQNNRLVIFDSKYLHTVLPVSNNVSFHTGRFSANIWIGRSSE
ncbi:MAG: 2OG-Fe(II) oxygenase [Cytophagaceae bacterium]|nr:2OG-Fe(II) oxygenase [Cytophagaceae bacterium]MDW8455610.1 2OG-Fe(II) oxygenase [Cytophagaceae bacterium]